MADQEDNAVKIDEDNVKSGEVIPAGSIVKAQDEDVARGGESAPKGEPNPIVGEPVKGVNPQDFANPEAVKYNAEHGTGANSIIAPVFEAASVSEIANAKGPVDGNGNPVD